MDKVMKAGIKNTLRHYIEFNGDMNEEQAVASLTALIIKWLESKKVEIIDPTPAGRINEMLDKKIRNQLITELIGEVK
jgi:hypothetical protein